MRTTGKATVHLKVENQLACKSRGMGLQVTTDAKMVTCRNCTHTKLYIWVQVLKGELSADNNASRA